MKTLVLRTTVAAILLAAAPAFAEPAATVIKKAPSARMVAFKAVGKELGVPFKAGAGNPIPLLDKLVRQPHSPAVSAQLMAAFGVPALVSVKPLPAAPGMLAYALAVPAQQFAEADGETMQWSALESTLELDAAGRNLTWNGSWPAFAFSDKDTNVALSTMSMTSTQQRTRSDLWIGDAAIKIAQMSISNAGNSINVTIDDIAIDATVAERAKLVDVGYSVTAKSLKVAGEQTDNLVLRVRMTNIDYKTFEEFSLKTSMANAPVTTKDLFGGNKKQYIAMAKNMAARGTRMEIDELSASFHGQKVTASGSLFLSPVKDADFATGAAFAKKVNARFDVKAPVGLVTEIAAVITRKQAQAKGQTISEEAVAQTAQMITDGMLAKLVATGYVSVQDGVLASTLVFKGGQLKVNNKPVALPTPKKAPTK